MMTWTRKKTAVVIAIALLLAMVMATSFVISVYRSDFQPRPAAASRPDRTRPRVMRLEADSPTAALGQAIKIHYTVSDKGGSHLNEVELWRGNGDGSGGDSSWAKI